MPSRSPRPFLAAVVFACSAAGPISFAADSAAETVELPVAKPAGRKVLEVIPGEKATRARFRMDVYELRQTVWRLLDEDGFRVQRDDAPIGDEGVTLKARKKLRNVECEIMPDGESGVSVLSIEYARFGSRGWAERAVEQITGEIGKHDPIAPARKRDNSTINERPASSDKAAIAGVQYFDDEVKVPEKKQALPIPRLSADPDSAEDSAEVVDLSAGKDPEPPAANVSASAEVVQLPEQRTAAAQPQQVAAQRKADSGEELFRSIQRGDVEETVGRERVNVYLEIRWLDATQPPAEKARRAFADQIAAALALRMIGSKAAVKIVDCADAHLRGKGANSDQLAGELDRLLNKNEVDADQQQMLKNAALALLKG